MNCRAWAMHFTATAIGAVSAAATALPAAEEKGGELYELKVYTLEARETAASQRLSSKRLCCLPSSCFGIGPMGVFVDKNPEDVVKVVMLTVFPERRSS